LTIEEYVVRAMGRRPVVGDRALLGNTELVVKEMEGERIVRVGLKLRRAVREP
jgi:cell volume regulation protein A